MSGDITLIRRETVPNGNDWGDGKGGRKGEALLRKNGRPSKQWGVPLGSFDHKGSAGSYYQGKRRRRDYLEEGGGGDGVR